MENIAIEFKNVNKAFSSTQSVLKDINLQVNEGEFITILGASGSGKTTLIKMINKLYKQDSGEVLLFNEKISKMNTIALRRSIGYVIQQVGLFPHMTLEENIMILPTILKWEKSTIKKKAKELFELINLDYLQYKDRYPLQLSGGQQQRVGVARALALNPQVMLLDEPFGALDAITRTILQDSLLEIQKQLNKTMMFVTHDIYEAFKLGSKVIIMNEGEIVQYDTPHNILKAPANAFVTNLLHSFKEQQAFLEEIQ